MRESYARSIFARVLQRLGFVSLLEITVSLRCNSQEFDVLLGACLQIWFMLSSAGEGTNLASIREVLDSPPNHELHLE